MNDPNLPLPGTPAYDTLAPFTKTPPNNRGQRTQLDPPPGPSAEGPSLAVVETRTSGTGRARLVGVQLGLEIKKGKQADFLQDQFVMSQVVGTIKWGIGSTEFEADFDWLHGSQIAVLAESVSVAARYVKNTLPWEPVPDNVSKYPVFVASAGVAYGAMPRISSGGRLTKIVQLDESGTLDIPIPPFAISFTVIPFQGPSTVPISVHTFGSYFASYIVVAPMSNLGQNNVENNFPLYNGAEFLRVTNPSDQSKFVGAVIFCLAL
jgi:hypothetical protein